MTNYFTLSCELYGLVSSTVARNHHRSSDSTRPGNYIDEVKYSNMAFEQQKNELADSVETVRSDPDVINTIESKKEKGRRWWERDDVIWLEIVLSISTLQGSRGAQLVLDENNEIDEDSYGKVSFEAIAETDPTQREEYLVEQLSSSKVNMYRMKSDWILSNYELIQSDCGDLISVKEEYDSRPDADSKIKYLKQFKGIGDKYARNIGMDLYDPDFRDKIAIDTRINAISEQLGLPYDEWGYQEHEAFYQSVARKLDIEGWELDRTLYNYKDRVKADL